MESCALCGEKRDLRMSHVVPNFVIKWLKETSATGFLFDINEPEKRIQDSAKMPLLCEKCEQKFSGLETYFAKTIFHPFLESSKRSFVYDSRLLRFIISLSWRQLTVTQQSLRDKLPKLMIFVDKERALSLHPSIFDRVRRKNRIPRKLDCTGSYL